jgi:hypothetical protein
MIDIELVEQSACGGLRLSKIEAAKAGEALVTTIANGRETASKEASAKVFAVVSFIIMLLGMITGRNSSPPAKLPVS